MTNTELHTQADALQHNVRAAAKNPLKAAALLPALLDQVFTLLHHIIDRLPENPHGQ